MPAGGLRRRAASWSCSRVMQRRCSGRRQHAGERGGPPERRRTARAAHRHGCRRSQRSMPHSKPPPAPRNLFRRLRRLHRGQTPDNASTTDHRTPVSYVVDASKPTLDNRRSGRKQRHADPVRRHESASGEVPQNHARSNARKRPQPPGQRYEGVVYVSDTTSPSRIVPADSTVA
jgi:hypothetical protein